MRIAWIPARSGSVRINKKNLQKIGGRTLVDIAVSGATASDVFEHVFVDSDDEDIIHEGTIRGAKSVGLRDPSTSQNNSTSEESLYSFLTKLQPELTDSCEIWILQPTSPLRTAATIRQFLQALPVDFESAASVSVPWQNPKDLIFTDKRIPDPILLNFQIGAGQRNIRFVDGCIYVVRYGHFTRTKRIFSPESSCLVEIDPVDGWDVDEEFQLEIARSLYDSRVGKKLDSPPRQQRI